MVALIYALHACAVGLLVHFSRSRLTASPNFLSIVHCPLSIVQRPLAVTRSSQYLHHVSLHSYTHKCRPLTYAAVLALTGRAPAVLFLLHLLPVSTNSLTRATTAALWPVVVCSPTLTAGPAAEFCCKFACLCRAHQQFRNSTVAS